MAKRSNKGKTQAPEQPMPANLLEVVERTALEAIFRKQQKGKQLTTREYEFLKRLKAKKDEDADHTKSKNVTPIDESGDLWLARMERLRRTRIESELKTAKGMALVGLGKMLQEEIKRTVMPHHKKLVIRFKPIGEEPKDAPREKQA
jgi:hypothetical protein